MSVDENLTELSELQLDVLREIGNVGAGNSATALSRLIQRRIEMNVPHVALVPIEDVPEFVGGPELVVVGIFLRVYGKAPSNILFLIPRESAFALVDTLLGRERGDRPGLRGEIRRQTTARGRHKRVKGAFKPRPHCDAQFRRSTHFGVKF